MTDLCERLRQYSGDPGPTSARELERLIREVQRLELIVDRLPRLGDGMPAVPGMMVHRIDHATGGSLMTAPVDYPSRVFGLPLSLWYSTEAAARAATEKAKERP